MRWIPETAYRWWSGHRPDLRAGVRSQLAQHPVINLLDSAEAGPGTVAVLVNEGPDETTLSRLLSVADSYAATGRVPCWW